MGTHYEQLTPEERATIMVMRNQHCSARHIARTLHRSASTITRELKRFATWQDRPAFVPAPESSCAYDARAAGVRARRQRFKPRRCSKLSVDTVLFGIVQHFLTERWSPSQIAGTLKRMWPDDSQRTVCMRAVNPC